MGNACCATAPNDVAEQGGNKRYADGGGSGSGGPNPSPGSGSPRMREAQPSSGAAPGMQLSTALALYVRPRVTFKRHPFPIGQGMLLSFEAPHTWKVKKGQGTEHPETPPPPGYLRVEVGDLTNGVILMKFSVEPTLSGLSLMDYITARLTTLTACGLPAPATVDRCTISARPSGCSKIVLDTNLTLWLVFVPVKEGMFLMVTASFVTPEPQVAACLQSTVEHVLASVQLDG